MWKPQPHWPIADWLGIVHRARAPRGGQIPIPALEILQFIYNSHNLGAKTVIPRVETPRTVWKPQSHCPIADWLGIVHRASSPRGGQIPIPALKILPDIFKTNYPGRKTVIPRVDTVPQGVETPTSLAGW